MGQGFPSCKGMHLQVVCVSFRFLARLVHPEIVYPFRTLITIALTSDGSVLKNRIFKKHAAELGENAYL